MTEWVTPQRLTSGVPEFVRRGITGGPWTPEDIVAGKHLRRSGAPDLSAAEAATVARFDAAPDAEESLRERVAWAIESDMDRRCLSCLRPIASDEDWAQIPEGEGEHLCWEPGICGVHVDGLTLASVTAAAALAVIRGDDA